ncbi:SDR family oxidoreductase [Sphingomonas sp. MS122]|uniref:SDR family oxidoreductase n=1 Tax=Sphingomonas sp. MS122 TaxID=3412683 RepID=UPI003C2DEEDE
MKSLVVTGGGRGIGRATALLAARAGSAVTLSYVADEAAARATVAEIEALGGQALAMRADTAAEADVIALFDAAAARFWGIDGVVVNAGIVGPAAMLADMELDRLRRMFDVNLLGALLTAREAARRLPRDRGGTGGAIVLVSSIAARLGAPFEYVDYAATKGALDSLTIGLSKELAPQGVRVNAVRPGLIETDIHASGGRPDRAQNLGAQTPIGRAGTADEVAEAILWLLGDASSYVTGAFIDIGGGR